MRHRLFTLAAACSALLFGAAAVMLAWSYIQPPPPTAIMPSAAPGGVISQSLVFHGYVVRSTIQTVTPASQLGGGYPIGGSRTGWNVLGVQREIATLTLMSPDDRHVVATLTRTTTFAVWLGTPLILFALIPAWWLIGRKSRLRRDRPKGSCPVCGYDLRASKDRCPECGTVIMPAAV